MMVRCEQCGKEFVKRGGMQRFCGTACRDANMTRVLVVTCGFCGHEFPRVPWEARRHRAQYCSPACYRRAAVGQPHASKPPEERHCLACGASFLVGGRGRPGKKVKYCSRDCGEAARRRRGAIPKTMTQPHAAYLAGIIDGEGSIILHMRRDDVVAMFVAIVNTSRGLLEWVEHTTGVGSIVDHDGGSLQRRPTWLWRANSEAAEAILRQVHPFLIVKKAQASLGIETQERLRVPALKADRSWQPKWRQRMKALNRRGPQEAGEAPGPAVTDG